MKFIFKRVPYSGVFPKNEIELKNRLSKIENLINNDEAIQDINVQFNEKAFKLMQDCNLLTEENIKFLINSQSCKGFNPDFRFAYLPNEGALRRAKHNNDRFGPDGNARFYAKKTMYIQGNDNDEMYFISNDWYKDHSSVPNKRQFYNWLKKKVEEAYIKRYLRQNNTVKSENEKPPEPQVIKKSVEISTDEIENFGKDIINLKRFVLALNKRDKIFKEYFIKVNQRIDNLENKIENIRKEVEEIKKLWEYIFRVSGKG